MLDIDKLVRFNDKPFLDLIEGYYSLPITNETIGYYSNHYCIGSYTELSFCLKISRCFWNTFSDSYTDNSLVQHRDHRQRVRTIKLLFNKHMGLKIKQIIT